MLTTAGRMLLTSARRSLFRFSRPATSFGSTLDVVVERVFIRRGLREEVQASVLETIVVKRRDGGTNQQNEEEKFE